MTGGDWATLAALSVLWGGSFYFLEILLRAWPPVTIILARVGFAAMLLWAYMRATHQPVPRGWRLWGAFSVLGLFGNALPFVLFAWGQQSIDSGLASILNATTALWGVVVAHLFTIDEKATPAKVTGVVLGLAGVIVMIGGDALGGLGSNVLAQIACLIGTLCYAIAGVYARRFTDSAIAVSLGQLATAAVMLAPIAVVIDKPWTLPPPDAATIWATVGMVVLATAIPYILYFRLIARAGANNAFLCTFTIPVVAILLGALFLGEVLALRHVAGMALIAVGLIAIDGRMFRQKAVAASPRVP
jgi:drug/metabolite transporter (DMT)-like permease